MNILIFTKQGKVLKTNTDEFPLMKRKSVGIKGITLKPKDEVVAVVKGE